MKKLLALLLSGMMVLSFTACGGDDVEDTNTGSDAQAEVEVDTTADDATEAGVEITNMYLAFGDMSEVDAYEIPDVSNSVWSFAGGMADNVQYTEEEYTYAMEAFGGTMYIILNDNNTAEMVQGGGTLQGKYMITGENTDQLAMSFDNNGEEVFYLCAMTVVEDIPVLIAYVDETYTNAVYFILQGEL